MILRLIWLWGWIRFSSVPPIGGIVIIPSLHTYSKEQRDSTRRIKSKMLSTFRFISILEGCSYLIILGVTFGIISRDYVYALGMLHGLLFMLYLVFSLIVGGKKNWSLIVWLPVFFASLIPFAFILVELYLRKLHIATMNPGRGQGNNFLKHSSQ